METSVENEVMNCPSCVRLVMLYRSEKRCEREKEKVVLKITASEMITKMCGVKKDLQRLEEILDRLANANGVRCDGYVLGELVIMSLLL